MEEDICTKLGITSNECIRKLCLSKKTNQNQIYFAIDPESEYYSDDLCQAIKNNDYDKVKKELKGNYWSTEFWTEIKENETKRRGVKIKKVANTSIVCKKCNKENVNVTMVQKRSADEGMTQCFECFNCGHCWQKS